MFLLLFFIDCSFIVLCMFVSVCFVCVFLFFDFSHYRLLCLILLLFGVLYYALPQLKNLTVAISMHPLCCLNMTTFICILYSINVLFPLNIYSILPLLLYMFVSSLVDTLLWFI